MKESLFLALMAWPLLRTAHHILEITARVKQHNCLSREVGRQYALTPNLLAQISWNIQNSCANLYQTGSQKTGMMIVG